MRERSCSDDIEAESGDVGLSRFKGATVAGSDCDGRSECGILGTGTLSSSSSAVLAGTKLGGGIGPTYGDVQIDGGGVGARRGEVKGDGEPEVIGDIEEECDTFL